VDGDALIAGLDTDVTNGTLTLNANGSFSYTPTADFNGFDSFAYFSNDGSADSNTVTVSITVTPVNDPPVAVDDSDNTSEDTPVTIDVLFNDNDPVEGNTLTVNSVTDPPYGTASNNGSNVTYTPDGNYAGSDVFSYTVIDAQGGTDNASVTVTVNPVNDPPVAADDSSGIATSEDTPVTVDVLANDNDPVEGNTLSVASVTDPPNGTAVNNGSDVTYTPDAHFFGFDTFSYTVMDASGGTDTAAVIVTVNSVNDAPVAIPDSATVEEGGTVTVLDSAAASVLNNDSDVDGDSLNALLDLDVTNGTLTLNADGSFSYTPTVDFNGSDSFTYYANDGSADSNTVTVSITVNPVNDPPVAKGDNFYPTEDIPCTVNVLQNDSDVDGDDLTVISVTQGTHGTVTNNINDVSYDPDLNYHGDDEFTYTISDGMGGSDIATVTISVISANDVPMASTDAYSTDEDSTLSVNAPGVLSNDSDVDGDALSALLNTDVTNGTLTLNANGSFSYTPTTDFNGADFFIYHANDGSADSNTVTVTLSVDPVNDPPVAADDSSGIGTSEDTPVTIDVLANDNDPVEGNTLSVASVTDPPNGTAVNNGTDVTYTPDGNYAGSDVFSYTVIDAQGGTDNASVTVTVNPVNDPPVAADDSGYATSEDLPVTIDVLANDTDVDGDALAVNSVSQGTNGTVTNNGTNVTYTPDPDFSGADSFTYTISDGNGGIDTASVSATVDPVIASILLVDDDSGTNNRVGDKYTYPEAPVDVDHIYKSDLQNIQMAYDVYSVQGQFTDGPDLTTLNNYPVVIWFAGRAPYYWGTPHQALTSIDQTNLMAYLDSGGRLFLSGEDILYELTDYAWGWTTVSNTLFNSYMGVLSVSDGVANAVSTIGVTGDPVSSGLRLTGSDSNSNGEVDNFDEFDPVEIVEMGNSIWDSLAAAPSGYGTLSLVPTSSDFSPAAFSGTYEITFMDDDILEFDNHSFWGYTDGLINPYVFYYWYEAIDGPEPNHFFKLYIDENAYEFFEVWGVNYPAWPDLLNSSGLPAYTHTLFVDGDGNMAATRSEQGTWKTIFLAFPYEGLGPESDRRIFLENSIIWLSQ
jgi:VCBS repeat-containing protein